MSKETSGYKTAFKSTAIFGGVQLFTILLNVAKTKVIALLMGTVGFGIISIYNTMTSFISTTTNLGLQSSAVRDISITFANNDKNALAQKHLAIMRCVYITSFIGAILTIIFARQLSYGLFEDYTHVIEIRLLSTVVGLMGIYNANYAFLQGIRRIKDMAKSTIYGALATFLLSLPLYYFFRTDGIVWSLIIGAVATTIVSYYFALRYKLPEISQTWKDTYRIGKGTVQLGIAMSIGSISVLLVQFIIKAFIVRQGGVADVGLYQAGWAINASYLGMVFTAIAKDYFPRLSSIHEDNEKMGIMVNEQAEIAILVLAPLISCLVLFIEPVVKLLYSSEFISIAPMTVWLLIGSLIKAGSWGISYVFLAKGNSKLYLFNELGIKLITVPSYLLGYHYFGLSGIGYAYTFIYCIFFLWVGLISHKKFKIQYDKPFWKLFFVLLFTLLLLPLTSNYLLKGIISLGIICFSLYHLNKRIQLISIIKGLLHEK